MLPGDGEQSTFSQPGKVRLNPSQGNTKAGGGQVGPACQSEVSWAGEDFQGGRQRPQTVMGVTG